MTTNAVPSTDPADLLTNAGVFDSFVNSATATVIDRMGRSRRTLAGLESEYPSAQTSMVSAAASAIAAQTAQTAAEAAASSALAAARTYATWAALSATTGTAAGQACEVLDSDAGTHTDPVVGGTVSNAGTYTWNTSPAGWKRTGATALSSVTAKAGTIAIPVGANSNFYGSAGNSTATGIQNTGGGKDALKQVTSGNYNSSTGYRALYSITTGQYNSAYGSSSLTSSTADANSAFGASSAQSNTTGTNIAAFGFQTALSNTTGSYNAAFGARASYSNVSGSYIAAFGYYALYSYTGSSATAFGAEAAYSATTATNLTAVGRRAAYGKTTGADCTFYGHQAGFSGAAGEINTADGVTALGAYSFGHTTTGSYNTGAGRASGWYNTIGSRNSFHGYRCGYGNTTGNDNIAMGFYAGHNTSTGSKNVMLGAYADFYVPDSTAMTATATAGGSMAAGAYGYRIAFVLDGVATALSETPATATLAGGNGSVTLNNIPVYSGPKTCSARLIYRTPVGGENLVYLTGTLANNTATSYVDSTVDGSLGAVPSHPSGSIMLGYKAWAYKAGQFVVGSSDAPISEVIVGGGVDSTAPATVTHMPSSGSGTNVAGATMRLAGGRGTGSAKSGSVVLAASPSGSTGSTQNALTDWITLDGDGSLNIKETTSAKVPTPAAGSVSLFAEGGALKIKTAAGSVLTLQAA